MEKVKTTVNNVKTSLSGLTFRSVIIFLIAALLIYGLISFFIWLFTGPSSPPQSAIHLISEDETTELNNVEQGSSNYRGVQIYNKPEVFNVRDNAYRFPEAEN